MPEVKTEGLYSFERNLRSLQEAHLFKLIKGGSCSKDLHGGFVNSFYYDDEDKVNPRTTEVPHNEGEVNPRTAEVPRKKFTIRLKKGIDYYIDIALKYPNGRSADTFRIMGKFPAELFSAENASSSDHDLTVVNSACQKVEAERHTGVYKSLYGLFSSSGSQEAAESRSFII